MKKLIFIISFLLLSGNIYSQWQSIGPYGGTLFALASTGNTVYGLNYSSIFKSTDNGITWSNNNLNIFPISGYDNKLLAKDNTLLLYNMGYMYKSTNGGINFVQFQNDSTPNVTSWIFKGNNIFASTYFKGILKSTNYGSNWISISGNLPIKYYFDIITDGSKIYVCGDTCIAKTTNEGINWVIINNNLPSGNYRKLCVSGNNLFVSINNLKIYKTTNDGISWTASGQGLPAVNIYDMISNGNALYAKSDSLNIYKSTDYGASWNLFNTGIVKNNNSRFVISGNYTISSTSIRGIFRTTPTDNQWNESNSGFAGMQVRNIISVGSKLYASCYENGLYSSIDNGNSWSRVNSLHLDSSVSYVSSIGTFPNHTLFIGFNNNSILYSTNDGISWIKSNTPNNYTYMATLSAFYYKPPYLFAGTENYGIMRSTDNGLNWYQYGAGLNSSFILCFYEFNGNLYAGTGSGVFMSSNNGVNWVNKSSGISGILTIYSLFNDGTRFFASGESGLYYSTNFGNNWIKLNLKIMTVIGGVNNNVHYLIGSTYDSVWVSYDHGDTWTGRSQNLKPYYFYSLSIINNYVFACSNSSSIWRRPLQEVILVKEISQNIPENYSLSQNYPNPFNPNTVIKFQIKDSRFVILKVYNILGKEIATLVNENMKAGEYEVTFNGSGLSSGIYFYRMQTGDFVQTKKMTLLK